MERKHRLKEIEITIQMQKMRTTQTSIETVMTNLRFLKNKMTDGTDEEESHLNKHMRNDSKESSEESEKFELREEKDE